MLQESISGRIDLPWIPVFRFASRAGCALALLLPLCPSGRQLTVTVVQSENGGAYQDFTNALRNALLSQNIPLAVTGVNKVIPDSGLVIAVGMKAAETVASSDAPFVLNVLVPKVGYEKLLRNFPRRAGSHTFSAIYLDQPVSRQVHLIAAILPDRHRVGLLFSTPPGELEQIRQEMGKRGLRLREKAVGTQSVSEALQELLLDSDMLLALPDSAIYNGSSIRNILLSTYRSRVPLIGFSSAYVKAGALCAVFSAPEQIAAQVATLIRQFGETRLLPAAQYPQEFEVMVNEQVAHSLGLHIRPAIELSAEIKFGEGSK
ncbi:MAG: ABC transporter substrate binding protein [Gallionella sp.]